MEKDETTSCQKGDWTSQNWTKRDGRNNHEQEQQEQEKKTTYKTAAELAVKNSQFSIFHHIFLPQYIPMNSFAPKLKVPQLFYQAIKKIV